MPTPKQLQEVVAMRAIRKNTICQFCRRGPLVALPTNYPTADMLCQFCNQTIQVKSVTVSAPSKGTPRRLSGAAWEPQRKRMRADIFHPLYIVTMYGGQAERIYYLAPHIQRLRKKMLFIPRRPLSSTALRAGWRGFYYDLRCCNPVDIRLLWQKSPKH